MTLNRGVMTSNRSDWETPPDIFADLEREFGPFDLDVCATPETAKCANYFTPEDDGLALPWHGRCFMNPPYGREIPKWVAKAHHEAEEGRATVVGLIPARTDAAWWHEHVLDVADVLFLKGRIRFHLNGERAGPAPFPSAVAVWRAEL